MWLRHRIGQLIREGRTWEEAVLTLYEEVKETPEEKKKKEAIREQISDHERSIERLTTLFSKGEINEESYKTAVRTIEKNIHELRKETTPASLRERYPSQPTYEKKPTSLWYLVPLLFGLLGGIIAYIAVKDEDKDMAANLLTIGIFMFVVYVFVIWAIYSWYISMMLGLY